MQHSELAADVERARQAGVPDSITSEVVKHHERLAPGDVARLAIEGHRISPDGRVTATLQYNVWQRVAAIGHAPSPPKPQPLPDAPPRPAGLHWSMEMPGENPRPIDRAYAALHATQRRDPTENRGW